MRRETGHTHTNTRPEQHHTTHDKNNTTNDHTASLTQTDSNAAVADALDSEALHCKVGVANTMMIGSRRGYPGCEIVTDNETAVKLVDPVIK